MAEQLDLSSTELVKVQQCSQGGLKQSPVMFEVKHYRFPDGRIVLVTKPENKKYIDRMLAVSRS